MKHKDEILRLRSEGRSYNEIQKELGCSKGTISYHLGVGQKDKTLNRQKDNRNNIRKYIQEYKQLKGCKDCKENYPYWILEFDHLGDKKFNISSARTSVTSIEEVIKEIEKCEVVCANCHKNRTYSRLLKTNNSTYSIEDFYE